MKLSGRRGKKRSLFSLISKDRFSRSGQSGPCNKPCQWGSFVSQVPTGHKTLQRSTQRWDRAQNVVTCNVTTPSSYTHSSFFSFPTMHLITPLFTLRFSGWASSSISAFTADHWNSTHTAPDLSDVQFSPAVTEMQPFSVNDDTQLTGLVGLIFFSHRSTQTVNTTYRSGKPWHASVGGVCWTIPGEVNASVTPKILSSAWDDTSFLHPPIQNSKLKTIWITWGTQRMRRREGKHTQHHGWVAMGVSPSLMLDHHNSHDSPESQTTEGKDEGTPTFPYSYSCYWLARQLQTRDVTSLCSHSPLAPHSFLCLKRNGCQSW